MADFFNKLKKSIDKNAAIIGAKSNTLIETNKLRADITATNKVKKDALLELGTKVYNMTNEEGLVLDAVEELVAKIREAERKVADLEDKIQVIQDEEKTKLEEIRAKEAEGDEVVVEAIEVVEDPMEEETLEGDEELGSEVDEEKNL